MRAAIVVSLLGLLATAPACGQILGAYTQGTASPTGSCTEETEKEDCPTGYGCSNDHCTLRCMQDGECGSYSRCSSKLCTVKIGTPCDGEDYSACSPLSCVTENVAGETVAGYCTAAPYNYTNGSCPPGLVSADNEYEDCLKP